MGRHRSLRRLDDAGGLAVRRRFPTPAVLEAAGKRRWQKFLHTYKLYRPQTADRRMELFAKAKAFASPNTAVTKAKSLLAVSQHKPYDEGRHTLDQVKHGSWVVKLLPDTPVPG